MAVPLGRHEAQHVRSIEDNHLQRALRDARLNLRRRKLLSDQLKLALIGTTPRPHSPSNEVMPADQNARITGTDCLCCDQPGFDQRNPA